MPFPTRDHPEPAQEIERQDTPPAAPTRKGQARIAAAASDAVDASVAGLREGFGLTRPKFARLGGFSERAVAGWEAGGPLSAPTQQRMTELKRLRDALAELIGSPEELGRWFDTPNPAFNDLKPIEVMERGQADRLWRMVYHLQAGEPS